MARHASIVFASAAIVGLGRVITGCAAKDCDLNPALNCGPYATGGGGSAATSSASASGGHGGGMGGGGNAPCGGSCKDPTPLCDQPNNKCVACLADADCKDAANAHCAQGSCIPCTASDQCKSHTGATSCDMGKCVECKLGEETACSGSKTCDLTADKCVSVAPGSVKNCVACTNDVQCKDMGAACIPLDFNKQPHGYFCLTAANPACQAQPFDVFVNKSSISGKATAKYCGVDEDLTTCEAVNATLAGWVCSGTAGKCGPMNMTEVEVPGALCKTVGVPNRCTYACNDVAQCPPGPPKNTCGDGMGGITGWCGG